LATFQNRVEALTQFAFGGSTDPSVTELTEFLKDGVLDVTRQSIQADPGSALDFQREGTTTAGNTFDTAGAQVISVIREAGADGDTDGSTAWEPCRRVSTALQSRVVDPDSLSFASKYNPVYIVDDDGLVNVYPTPDGTDDGYRVFYVNNEPLDETNDASVVYTHSDLKYFPAHKVYLVVLYASIKTLEAAAGSKTGAQDIELQGSYSQLAASLRAEYMAAFQTQQQPTGAPRR
jgi:hypothetical protein